MTDEPVDFAREYFRHADRKLERILEVMSDVLLRLGSLEQKVAFIATDIARIDGRLDGMN